jgi:hypothetical protein
VHSATGCFSIILLNYYLLHVVHTFCGAHPASYPVVLGALFPELKRPGREADNSPPISVEVKSTWIYTPTPPYVFIAYCLITSAQGEVYFLPRVRLSPSVFRQYCTSSGEQTKHWSFGGIIVVRGEAKYSEKNLT